MIEREKVLHGLECCIKKLEGQMACDECPYDEDFNCLGCSVVLRRALDLLKEQEAEIRQLRLALDIAKGTCKGIKCGQFADMPTMQSAT